MDSRKCIVFALLLIIATIPYPTLAQVTYATTPFYQSKENSPCNPGDVTISVAQTGPIAFFHNVDGPKTFVSICSRSATLSADPIFQSYSTKTNTNENTIVYLQGNVASLSKANDALTVRLNSLQTELEALKAVLLKARLTSAPISASANAAKGNASATIDSASQSK
jgi:hypothetical protein